MTQTRKKRRGAGAADLIAAGLMACVWLAAGQCAMAQDAAPDIDQYAHTVWKARDGFAKGYITSLAQTPDGYLWLGTGSGLFRFDGVRAVPWENPAGEQLPGNSVSDLLVTRDGALWISTTKGLASWRDGKLRIQPEVAGQILNVLIQDHAGTIWAGITNPGRLCAVQNGKVQCYGEGSFGVGVYSLHEDRKGNLWVVAQTGLWRWKPGNPEHYVLPGIQVDRISETETGELLLATSDGLKKFMGGRVENYTLPGITERFRFTCFFHRRDGSLWIGAQQGLLRLYRGRTETFGTTEGLSGDVVFRIFDDREGNLWVATINGLDRFREYAIKTLSKRQGLSTSSIWSVQATSDGHIWMGTSNGLNRWKNGETSVYGRRTGPEKTATTPLSHSEAGLASTAHGLGLDGQGRLCVSTRDGVFYFDGGRFVRFPGVKAENIWSIASDGRGKLWMNDGTEGLFYLAPGEAAQPIPWSRFGQKGLGPQAMLPDRSNGGIWLGFLDGGVAYFQDGKVRTSYSATEGLGSGRVSQLRFGSRGAVWASTEGGLSRIKGGHIETLSSKNGLPCNNVLWSMEDGDHAVWVYMTCGLVRIERAEWYTWADDPTHIIKTIVFDVSDGVVSLPRYGGYAPYVTKAPDGKIWFAAYDGVSVIDPQHLAYNKVPPPVHVEQITADRKNYGRVAYGNERVSLPPLSRDLEIDYTALSLAVPEKVRFRYKLEGRDRDWVDAGNRRQAFYSDLSPRNYRFRVTACNNSGVWNEEGAFMDFSIAPAYYQTNWFRALCVAAFVALLWALYEIRLRGIQREFNVGLEERLKERTRIARELHDTLLQNLHGLLFRFQAARNLFPRRPEQAMETLDEAIAKTEQAITESQDAITDLRPAAASNDLGELVRAAGKELETTGNGNGTAATFALTVEGMRRSLSPVLQDEVYRIALELLRNAFRHASARRVEAEVRYDEEQLRVRIRDDGKGMDPEVMKKGRRPGHWGLLGAKERAQRIGAHLDIWSEVGAGTEIQISVPAAVAYKNSHDRPKFRLFRGVRS